MGTPPFAVPSLERLSDAGHALLVVTQPARPAGRGLEPRPSAVRVAAEARGLSVLERASLRDAGSREPLAAFRPDLVVVVAFGLILRRSILALPDLMPINLHPSRLPELRGVAPIPWTVWSGAGETAVTTIRMDSGVDTGDLLLQEPVPVGARVTAGELTAQLATRGADLLVRTVRGVSQGAVTPRPQPAAGATYAPRLVKAHGHLDWSRPAVELDRQVRATTPWPRARARLGEHPVTVVEARPATDGGAETGPPGSIVECAPERLVVATGAGALELVTVQPAGKPVMSGAAFARGRRLGAGDRFESLPVPPDLEWPRPVGGAR